MLKLLEKIEAKTEHRVPAQTVKLALVDFDAIAPRPEECRDWWTWQISVTLQHRAAGPEDARPVLLSNARRAIAHEVYGEIEDEIRLTLRDLWDDGLYHSKAADRLENLLPLLRGER